MTRHVLCRREDLTPGALFAAQAGRMPVVVTLAGDRPVVVAARCPHQGADLCHGAVSRRIDADADGNLVADPERMVLRCPWHGFEFDLASGDAVVSPPSHLRLRLRRLAATFDGDDVVVEV